MNNYSYLSPASRAHKIDPTKSHLFDRSASELKGNTQTTQRRKIFGLPTQKYQEHQIQALQRIKQYLKHKDPSKNYADSLLLKYCYLGKFMTAESVQKFHYYQDWHSLTDISKDKEKGILHSGVFYCYGKDQGYSPSIYFNPSKIDLLKFDVHDYLVCLRTLLKPIQQYMLVPGKVQHWNIIVDLRNSEQKKTKELYNQGVNSIMKVMYAYPYRLKKLFVIENKKWKKWDKWEGNGSPSAVFLKNFLFDLNMNGIEKRVHIIHDVKVLSQYIPDDEREKEYGGNLDNLCQFWPIQTTNKLVQMNSGFQELSLDSQEYLSVMNEQNQLYFQEEERSAICDFKSCSIF